ncbi:MAG: ATP-binding cassette domain-containing protein [Candidatus Nomurabacteria bacterium]|nr:MAG: ATP-binding cassette domain-containing protein [Candidatus Nomurabacteria bacterium]
MTNPDYSPNTHKLGIHAKNLSVTTTAGETLLDDITLNIRQGEFVAIHGQSGAGKSLLATALCGIRFQEKREPRRLEKSIRDKIAGAAALVGLHFSEKKNPVRYTGDVSYSLSPQLGGDGGVSLPHDYNILRQHIGFVPQEPLLDGKMTARDNILIPARLKQIPIDFETLDEVYYQIGLDDMMLDKKTGDLSGGQKQRVSIARALTGIPNAVVLDEPTANLNPKLKDETNQMLERLNRRFGMTVISVTHEDSLATRIIEMDQGRIVADTDYTDRLDRYPQQ